MVVGFTPSIFGKNDAKPWVLEANPFHLFLIILAYQRTFWDWNPSSQIDAGRYANGKKNLPSTRSSEETNENLLVDHLVSTFYNLRHA